MWASIGIRFRFWFHVLQFWHHLGITSSRYNFTSILLDAWLIFETYDPQNILLFVDTFPKISLHVLIDLGESIVGRSTNKVRHIFSYFFAIGFGFDLRMILDSILAPLGNHLAPSGPKVASAKSHQKAPKKHPTRSLFAGPGTTCFQDLHRALPGAIFSRFGIDLDTIFTNMGNACRT